MDIQKALNKSKIVLKDSKSIEDLEKLIYDNKCLTHPIWKNYATRLDESPLFYFLPEQYKALVLLTGIEPPYLKASTENNVIQMYLVGKCREKQSFGPFWNNTCQTNFMKHSQSMTDTDIAIFSFAREVDHDLNVAIKNDTFEQCLRNWSDSFAASYHYLTLHRRCVIQTGKVFNVDMTDHDLTKTRLVQIALGRSYHWPDEKQGPWDKKVDKLANETVLQGHLKQENHHPQFDQGPLDAIKLFVDRLSVHIQKDPNDEKGGWGINEMLFIPTECEKQWKPFKNTHKHLDLYKLSWNIVSKSPVDMTDYN